ncbi:uncharacterized protein UHOD_06913 [Ustilago sp. UG-2017b]|nr:uncharacterized protein UHOD_06913 [Ustilago sp. UG-2017b]
MEPALPLPLRLDLTHSPVPTSHESVSESISHFLSAYAARTGTQNAASSSDDPSSSSSSASTGGVVAAQLTRLMNGLARKIDHDIFANLFPTTSTTAADSVDIDQEEVDQLETPREVLDGSQKRGARGGDGEGRESFSKPDELSYAETPNLDDSLTTEDPMHDAEEESPRKKSKKEKKEKKGKKEKKVKSEA